MNGWMDVCLDGHMNGGMDGMQVWLGRQVEPDPQNPAWQELLSSHKAASGAGGDSDELGGARLLRSRQRITLTTIMQLPPGNSLNRPAQWCSLLLYRFSKMIAHDSRSVHDTRVFAHTWPLGCSWLQTLPL